MRNEQEYNTEQSVNTSFIHNNFQLFMQQKKKKQSFFNIITRKKNTQRKENQQPINEFNIRIASFVICSFSDLLA